jgi:hypothetical protein
MITKTSLFAIAMSGALLALGCQSKKEPAPNALAQIASSKPSLMGAKPATVTPPSTPAKPIIRRPSGLEDLVLTAERRARIEAAYPEAKGFLDGAELESRLYEQRLPRGKDTKARATLDALAQGKWVLFTGNLMNATKDGFELALRYTPRDAKDRLGLTSTWLGIEFSNISGYDSSQYRAGEPVAILARYDGKQRAVAGYDLVLSNRWFVATP